MFFYCCCCVLGVGIESGHFFGVEKLSFAKHLFSVCAVSEMDFRVYFQHCNNIMFVHTHSAHGKNNKWPIFVEPLTTGYNNIYYSPVTDLSLVCSLSLAVALSLALSLPLSSSSSSLLAISVFLLIQPRPRLFFSHFFLAASHSSLAANHTEIHQIHNFRFCLRYDKISKIDYNFIILMHPM